MKVKLTVSFVTGKMFGIEANYYIAEAEYQEGEGEDEEEDEPPPQEQVIHCNY